MTKPTKPKQITWIMLALMSFSSVWGFRNVINGFAEYGGLQVIFSWIIVFAFYFIPYTLMVGELGSTFKESEGGISYWVRSTINAKMAYYAGWAFWVVELPYLCQKPNSTLIAGSWLIFQDNRISRMDTLTLQILCLIVFIIAMLVARRGIRVIKKLATFSGAAMLVMSILYILLACTAPYITHTSPTHIDWSIHTFIPKIDVNFFAGLSILLFAVGGCEIVAPYVNRMKNPSKDFPKGMIALAVMVAGCAVLGTIAMGMMFDVNNIPDDLMTNGAYYAFQQLGNYYHAGNLFMILYAVADLVGQFSLMVLCIDAPLLVLLGSTDETYIPKKMFEKNKYGTYTNGHKLVFVIVALLIIMPALGIKNVDVLVKWLVQVNAICVPLCYLWIFIPYIALKCKSDKFHSQYRFVKNKKLGIFIGGWCIALTVVSVISGIYSNDPFQLTLNIVIPLFLFALGFIMPKLAQRQSKNNTDGD